MSKQVLPYKPEGHYTYQKALVMQASMGPYRRDTEVNVLRSYLRLHCAI